MVRLRKQREGMLDYPSSPTRFDRMPRETLFLTLESSLQRSAELFRGLEHSELDPRWVLHQMHIQVDQALQIVLALERKVDS
jgi:hypothetical protein